MIVSSEREWTAGAPVRFRRPKGSETRPISVATAAVWFGLVTGLIELGILLVRHMWSAESTLGSLQANRHFLWMVPVTHVAVFAMISLPLTALAWFRPTLGRWGAALVLAGFLSFCLLLMVPGLRTRDAAVLAIGLGSVTARRLGSCREKCHRFVRLSLPVGIGVVGVLGAVTYDRTVLAERRALRALPNPPPNAPNVLMIVLDTVRADRLSLQGYGRETTPHLARLARRGVTFREARSTAPWTLPSHASLFTGRWPHELGKVPGGGVLDETYPTLANFFAAKGYATAGFVGNTYFCNSWFGLGRGFAHYEDYYESGDQVSAGETLRCTAMGRKLLALVPPAYNVRPGTLHNMKDAECVNRDFLRWLSRNRSRPFFVFLNYLDAHDPYLTPPNFDRHFGIHPETPADVETIRSWHSARKRSVSSRDLALVSDAYDDCLAYLDEQLGRLFDELDHVGVLNKTVVVVTSDHGEGFGEHALFLHAQSLYRHEVHVPLIVVAPPTVRPGQVVDQVVSLRDLATTVTDLAGLSGDSPFPGHSLARFWSANPGGTPHADPVMSQVSLRSKVSNNPDRPPALRGPVHSITLDGMVYIREANGNEELYRVSDTAEQDNLAGHAEVRSELTRYRSILDRLIAER